MLYSSHTHTEDPLYQPVVIHDKQRHWRRILIVDDNVDITTSFKAAIEDSNSGIDANKRIEVYTANDRVVVLSEFKQKYIFC